MAMSDLWVAPVANPGQAHTLLDSAFVETHGHLAPGGDWFVYGSNETGRLEVYVDRFPSAARNGSSRGKEADGLDGRATAPRSSTCRRTTT
jgi:hypothetical protein